MSAKRRDFLKELFTAGALPALSARPGAFGVLLDPQALQQANPDFDADAYNFWSGFTANNGQPAIVGHGQTRGAKTAPNQPVFLHHGQDGFKNAAMLDQAKMIEKGDVMVSVNTSVVKVGDDDQKTFEKLQNAQLRVDVAQKTGIIPQIEAMAYTVVGAMRSAQSATKTKASTKSSSSSASKSSSSPTVQNISISSDAAWQKMQNIPLPTGEGRWALNLEAQKKDALFCKILENLVKEGNLFAPMLSLPGIAMSALNSFNNLYGALHSEPVQIIKSNPVRVFATQEAIESTGATAAEIGAVLLQPGTYVLMAAGQAPTDDQLKSLTLVQDRIVQASDAKLTGDDLDAAAADLDVLKNVTYVTFNVQVAGMSLFGSAGKSPG
jgi:ribosomal protein L15